MHVSVKDNALAFELTPAAPKLVKRAVKGDAAKKPARKSKAQPETGGDDGSE